MLVYRFKWYFGAVTTSTTNPFYNATLYHNSAVPHSLPMGFDLWINGMLSEAPVSKGSTMELAAHPWPLTPGEKETVQVSLLLLVLQLIILLAVDCFIIDYSADYTRILLYSSILCVVRCSRAPSKLACGTALSYQALFSTDSPQQHSANTRILKCRLLQEWLDSVQLHSSASFCIQALLTEVLLQTKTMHIQTVSGVGKEYYMASYLWDFFVYLIPALLLVVLVQLFDVQALSRNTDALILLVLLYGLSVIPYSYCLSFLFSEYATATVSSSQSLAPSALLRKLSADAAIMCMCSLR